MKRLKITPEKHTQSGRWQVRIPAKLSGSGKRETKYFPTKAEAMGYISNLEDVAAGLHLGETLMTRSEYDAIIEELARLAPFDVTLKDVIDYYIARHRASDAKKIAVLVPLYMETLKDMSRQYRAAVRQIIKRFCLDFGDNLIDDLMPEQFEEWLSEWKKTPSAYNFALRHIKPFHEFRAELAAVLARLPEMDLTNDDLLQEALWDASAEAYRKGWEINRIEDEI